MSGRMHVKTGSLDEVAAVAGYVYSQSNTLYTVVGIVNHELADRGPGAELLDELLTWVYLQ
jgi:D-alanyl-D-alanine carboxypeptidase/D-alanyl-D-alanine-endopeptidase (penicillin-binding protein 4)